MLTPPAKLASYWGEGYPKERAERRFIDGDPPPRWDRRKVSSPLTDEMLRPSPSGKGVVQFDRLLTDGDFRRLADWLRAHPGMTLRAYASTEIRDLEFLRFFPSVRRFDADSLYGLASLEGCVICPTTRSCS